MTKLRSHEITMDNVHWRVLHAACVRGTGASQGSAAKGRAWANLFLLGSEAKAIAAMLKGAKLNKKEQETLSIFQSRLE